MRLLCLAVLLLPLGVGPANGFAAPPPPARQWYEEDFDVLWAEVGAGYAYFDKKATDWAKVKTLYRPQLKAVTTREEFIALLERVLEELYDPHTHLNTNTASSPRLIPSGTDVWAAWSKGRAIITQVRHGSNAERAGLKAGTEVLSIGGVAVRAAVDQRVGRCLRSPDPAARDWALRALLAGRHDQQRRLGVRTGEGLREVAIEDRQQERGKGGPAQPLLLHKRLGKDQALGYVRINNSLGSVELIREFDAALGKLRGCAGLVLDLRDTPGGGNTTVARGILGRFIGREGFYQRHSLPAEERRYGVRRSWAEAVSPRGDFRYAAPVVVLVDRWTGSMGEGIAIGLDGLKRATVVGTEMAGLLGATGGVTLPNSKIGVSFPVEKLFHVKGTPREDFVPPVYVDPLKPDERKAHDAVLETGLRTLQTLIKENRAK